VSNASAPGTWLADLCAREGLPFVLGHARYRKASHGGKATHDTIDAQKMAVLLRGGRLPQADVYPADMRATRDLLRRRMPLLRTRAERLAHLHPTNRQDNLPAIGKKLASKANRDGVAARVPDPAVQTSMAVDRARLNHDDCLLGNLERSILTTATPHHAQTRYLLRPVPGIGEILRLVRRDDIHDIGRCPRVQDVVSDGRLVKCTKESAGKRSGPSGTKIGHAYLTWAFSAAAVLFLRHNPAGQKSLTTMEKEHGQGNALTMLAHQLGRAVYDMLKRPPAFDRRRFLAGSWGGADEPNASRDDHGLSLSFVLGHACIAASWNAEHIGPFARILWPLIGHPLRLLYMRRESRSVDVGRPSPAPGTNWRPTSVQPRRCVGRYAGTERFRGRSGRHHRLSAITISMVTEPPDGCGADPLCLDRHVEIQPEHVARGRRRQDQKTRNTGTKSAHRGRVSLDHRGPHKG